MLLRDISDFECIDISGNEINLVSISYYNLFVDNMPCLVYCVQTKDNACKSLIMIK